MEIPRAVGKLNPLRDKNEGKYPVGGEDTCLVTTACPDDRRA